MVGSGQFRQGTGQVENDLGVIDVRQEGLRIDGLDLPQCNNLLGRGWFHKGDVEHDSGQRWPVPPS